MTMNFVIMRKVVLNKLQKILIETQEKFLLINNDIISKGSPTGKLGF